MESKHVNKHVTQKVLLEEIEFVREIMVYTALKEGLVSDNTVKMSQVLDMMLNELEEIQ
ncbi:aspartyl-phosphate phosphatase Spo0E family protein [Priestia megaterium]|jgi:stage 0 sporulation regulatory protein|uniref:Stage 0 sporulation regulatory protein n=1 Tax=Priestia aryabhattai TaxID=412384 RepID=A0A7W3NHI3_PRIAR|nr:MULTISPECIES: aspartyl-phosphate phosphatase Spo0E family protein [Priestia]MCJ7982991.1 aspartyl-phosphate phosphatase Spo0E family protein [Priestia sp. OVL9]MBA9043018.1 stage 0 sporulation regulatory protein [Priestia aryabhattai]MBD8114852.1 aspartyl-phosphate phosphatase Spo0E family protein [Priestia megaterium]MBM6602364.1 aspartyl-phosphate phosphatase Spo0E family protein [Priestia megaterium]MBU8588927.1 aspartyl-phosphate phosphatase Spo0E family protein [Priestia megaterium]